MQVLEPSTTVHFPMSMTKEEADARANKLYLVLFEFYPPEDDESDEGETMSWRYCRGTQTAYNFIRETIIERELANTPVNFNNSFIVVESVKRTIAAPLPIYDFMKEMIEKDKVIEDTGFNIDDYTDIGYNDPVGDVNPSELRYGQGDNPEQYTEAETINGGEV